MFGRARLIIRALLGGLLASAPGAALSALPGPLAHAVKTSGIPAEHIAVLVQDTAASQPLLVHNAERPMNPASVIKLLTTYAGLEQLGPAFAWTTEVYVTGPLRDGVLDGDLVIRGQGDPKLTLEQFWLLLRSVRARGVREIRGDLVLDRSYYGIARGDPASFDGDPHRPYNTLPDALLVNHQAVRLLFLPDPERKQVRIVPEPVLAEIHIGNNLVLDQAPCGDWRGRMRAEARTEGGVTRLAFSGPYSAQCGEQALYYSVLNSPAYAGSIFRQLWTELGGSFLGGVREGLAPDNGRPLVTQESPALAEVIRDINKFSNNAMARQLYLTLGATAFGAPASPEKSDRAVRAWLARKQLDFPELTLENGSGLSRIERISANSLAALLIAAWRSPVMPELIASMPLMGVDGTLRRRTQHAGLVGQAHIKGGTINGVRAMAGYLLDGAGRRWVVICMINHPTVTNASAQPVFDTLLRWVHGLDERCCRRQGQPAGAGASGLDPPHGGSKPAQPKRAAAG